MGERVSKVFIVRSLEEVWTVWGVYLFQSRERTSAWGCAVILPVAAIISTFHGSGKEGLGGGR